MASSPLTLYISVEVFYDPEVAQTKKYKKKNLKLFVHGKHAFLDEDKKNALERGQNTTLRM